MNKIIIAAVMIFFLIGCGEGGCKDLSWESDGYTADTQVSFKASAGEKCENYNDYWDGDLNKVIAQIQNMKFVLNRKCYEMQSTDGDPKKLRLNVLNLFRKPSSLVKW